MDIVTKIKTEISERRRRDDTEAKLAKLEANQDYISMMADIDLDDGCTEREVV